MLYGVRLTRLDLVKYYTMCGATTLIITTLSMTLSIMSFSITTLSIMTFSIMALSIMTFSKTINKMRLLA
jgi:hypothetical protein